MRLSTSKPSSFVILAETESIRALESAIEKSAGTSQIRNIDLALSSSIQNATDSEIGANDFAINSISYLCKKKVHNTRLHQGRRLYYLQV